MHFQTLVMMMVMGVLVMLLVVLIFLNVALPDHVAGIQLVMAVVVDFSKQVLEVQIGVVNKSDINYKLN